jgi:ribonuclease D
VVLRDHLLVEIARRGWTQPQDIRTLRGISLNDRALRQLCAAVQRAQALPVEQCPKSNATLEETPRESMAISLITAIIRDHCLEHHLAYGLVTSKHDIRTLVVSHVRGEEPASLPPLMRGWRKKAFGPLLTQVLGGQCAVRLTTTPDGPGLAYNETQPPAEAE